MMMILSGSWGGRGGEAAEQVLSSWIFREMKNMVKNENVLMNPYSESLFPSSWEQCRWSPVFESLLKKYFKHFQLPQQSYRSTAAMLKNPKFELRIWLKRYARTHHAPATLQITGQDWYCQVWKNESTAKIRHSSWESRFAISHHYHHLNNSCHETKGV